MNLGGSWLGLAGRVASPLRMASLGSVTSLGSSGLVLSSRCAAMPVKNGRVWVPSTKGQKW